MIRSAPDYEHPAALVASRNRTTARQVPDGNRPEPEPAGVRHEGAVVRRFAVGALTVLFEALDGRRGFGQLSTSVSPELTDRFRVLRQLGVRPHARDLAPAAAGSATLRRVHVQMSGEATARIFGSYTIGGRVRAFCGVAVRSPHRIPRPIDADVLMPARWEYRWQLTALDFC
ncbi:Rv3235 family protein [Gordonia sp. (in: high G+C Gram-positive bacteria)]|uniref:Rv3235 family protein n=1 Tax=Gordonia sp. (in: high G+C Gram-positive bacteria) TaxID=84139 RepID=UPI001D9A7F84|nr:Rv3235 family protein [Gordonia sp. (in: high G+C Gram-positive bacteria)]MCB1296864.1 hypothetical protein [Gordonia sp. (in: high G+C Gram-positive bacteria)]HMS74083.1 Rv3235 family protein [Gordonia sp. (in: high G+C Gram-positive bacteria)]